MTKSKTKRKSKPDLRPVNFSVAYANFIVGCLTDNLTNKPNYTESHHILPRCRGGGNEPGNLVDLSGSQHFIAHKLLSLANPGCNKLTHAMSAFTMTAEGRLLTHEELDSAKEAKSAGLKLQHKDPEFVALIAAGRNAYNAKPETKQKNRDLMAIRYARPGAIEKVAEHFRKLALSPDHHNKAEYTCPTAVS